MGFLFMGYINLRRTVKENPQRMAEIDYEGEEDAMRVPFALQASA